MKFFTLFKETFCKQWANRFDTLKIQRNFQLCKETLEIFTVVKGLAMQTDLFASNEPIDLDRLHEFLVSVVNRK